MTQYPPPPSYAQYQNMAANLTYNNSYSTVLPSSAYMNTSIQPPPPFNNTSPGSHQPISYEQMINYRSTLVQQQRQYQAKRLEERYPVKYAIVHSAAMILLSITTITLQIIMIINKSSMYQVGSGIWVGAFFILAASLVLLLIKFRNYCLYIITLVAHMFGFVISLGALLAVNVVGYSKSVCDEMPSKTTMCMTYESSAYHIPMLVIAPLLAILSLTFLMTTNCYINGTLCQPTLPTTTTTTTQMVNYSRNNMVQPVTINNNEYN